MPDIQPIINELVEESGIKVGHARKVVYLSTIPGDPTQWVMTNWDLVTEEKRTTLCQSRNDAFTFAGEDGFDQFVRIDANGQNELLFSAWEAWRAEQGWVDGDDD